MKRSAAIIAAVVSFICAAPAAAAAGETKPRVPAEWEPALGALVSWPPIVPDELLVEIAKDDRLFVMVSDDKDRKEAETALTALKIDPRSVQYIVAASSDAHPYTRDWGPPGVFDADGRYELVDPRFVDYPMATAACGARVYSEKIAWLTRFTEDDAATAAIGTALHLPVLGLPIALTGGNALVDGHGAAFSTCVMLDENRQYFGVGRDEFLRTVESRLGIERYVIIPNFEWFGIQHIDCLLKPLDEETILVKRLPEGHPSHDAIESIVATLAAARGPYGRPYRIRRIDTPPYALGFLPPSYTNSLILNRKVLVPLFGNAADEQALRTWREAMPGYRVVGFTNRKRYGWNWTDALHCRVRAVWDPEMLYMTHRRPDDPVAAAAAYPLEVTIHDYSRKGLVGDALALAWRRRGETAWNRLPLKPDAEPFLYAASIPLAAGDTIEYYFAAADVSGRHETLPRVAPDGFYSFSVGPAQSGPSVHAGR